MTFRIRPALVLVSLTALPSACSLVTGDAESTARSAQLEQWWKLYQADAPAWPDARTRWVALGQQEKESLVFNLIAEMNRTATTSRGTADGLEPGWKRAERELLFVDAATAVPILVTTLRTWRDTVALEAVGDALIQFGADGALIAALDRPERDDSPQFRGAAVRCLVAIGGEKAIARVGAEGKSAADPLVRGSAIAALGRARRSDHARAASALVAALDVKDPVVAETVLAAIEDLDEPAAAPGVALFHRAARAAGNAPSAKAAARAANLMRKLTGTTVPGDDPEAWIRECKAMFEDRK